MALIDPFVNIPSTTRPLSFDADAENFFNVQFPQKVTDISAAAVAMNLNSTNSTSTTSMLIGAGAKTLTVQINKSYLAGMNIVAAVTASSSTNFVNAKVDSYVAATGVLNFTVQAGDFGGSGTFAAWSISQGPAGGATTTFVNQAAQNQSATAFTTGGTSSAYILTPSPALTALATNQRFNMTLNAAPTGSPTLAVSGLLAKSLKYYDSTGTKQFLVAAVAPIGWNSDVIYDGADWVMQDVVVPKNKTFIGSFTRNMAGATTTQVITGVGFTPRKVRFFMSNPANGTTAQFSIGEDNGTSAFCVYDSNVTTANTNAIDTSNSIRAQGAASNQTGKISAFSSDGFTISWTLTSTGAAFTGTISYVAED